MDLRSSGVAHFSSDFNADTLVYASRDGSIVRNGVSLAPDHYKKDVKCYPPDDAVYTTTDVTGLRVWDAARAVAIYRYRNPGLARHAYSDACVLAAFDDRSIRLYDLRCRYPTQSFAKSRCAGIGWAGSQLYVHDGDALAVYDCRSFSVELHVRNVRDFAIGGPLCYAIHEVDGVSMLSSIGSSGAFGRLRGAPLDGAVHDGPGSRSGPPAESAARILQKKTQYKRIFATKYRDSIACLDGSRIRIESFDGTRELPVSEEVKQLDAVYLGREGGHLFMNGNLYAVSRSMYE